MSTTTNEENNSELKFRAYIVKQRRIHVPKNLVEVNEGELYEVTLKKVDNNNS